jgi:hypothetical protein
MPQRQAKRRNVSGYFAKNEKTAMKKIFLILIILNFSCSKDKFHKEYYSNGNLALKITLDDKGVRNGPYEEYYESGELKVTGQLLNGEVKDSVFVYYPNGKIREKGFFKNGHRQNWQEIYNEKNKLLRREEYYELRDSAYLNQVIVYKANGKIDHTKSSFFKLNIPDTIKLGKNKLTLNYYDNTTKSDYNFLNVIIENQYSEKEIKNDTFTDGTRNPFFGVYAYKEGKLLIKGKIEEKILKERLIGKDSAELEITDLYKYFEKEVYVKGKSNKK